MAIKINDKTLKNLNATKNISIPVSSNAIDIESNINKDAYTQKSSIGSVTNTSQNLTTNTITEFSENLERDRSFFKKIASPISKMADMFNSLPKEELYHRKLVDLITQLKTTEIIVNSNSEKLEEAAESDQDVAELLSTLNKSSGVREQLSEKILDRQEFSIEEASQLLSSLDSAVGVLDRVNTTLDINLSDITKQYNELIKDSRVDLSHKKKLLDEIKQYVKDSKVDSKSIRELNKINIDDLKFSKEGTIQISRLLSQIEQDTRGAKIQGSLKELNSKYDKSVLTQEEVNKVLTSPIKTEEGDKTFRERFLEKPGLYSAGKAVKTGAIGLGLNVLGLSGLEQFGAVEKISEFLSVDTLKKAGGLFKREKKEPKEDISIKIDPTVDKVSASVENITESIDSTIPSFNGTTKAADKLAEAMENVTQISKDHTEAITKNREALSESVEDFSKSLGKENKGLTKSLKSFKSSLDAGTKSGFLRSMMDKIRPSGGGRIGGLLRKIPGVKGLLGKIPGLGAGAGGVGKVGGITKGLGLGAKLGGLGSALTGGAGLGGLLTTGVGSIGTMGAGAMATSAGLVGLAGAAGLGVGTLASKGIDKLIGRGKGGLGDILFEKIYGKEGITGKGQERLLKVERESLAKFKGVMSSEAFGLLGDEPSGVADRFMSLKQQGTIIKFEGKFLTKDEYDQAKLEKTKEDVEQMAKEKTEAIGIKEPEVIDEEITKGKIAERPLEDKAITPIAEITREGIAARGISPETTVISKQIGALAQTVTSMTAAVGGSSAGPTKQGTGRTKVIDDFGIAFFNSMIFE